MKLSTENLSKTLQNIKPMKKLSGKLQRAVGQKSANKNSSGKGAASSEPSASKGSSDVDDNDIDDPTSSEIKAERSSSENSDTKTKAAKANSAKAKAAKTGAVPGFIQNSKLVQNSKGARVAFHLLLVKPWVLVVGLWLISALCAVVAIEGLVSPSKLTQDLPEPAADSAPIAKTNSFIDVEQGAEGITADGDEAGEAELEASEVAASNSRLPVWPLVTLVGSCAAGCVVISRRRAMMRIAAARAKGRGRKPQMAKVQNAPTRLKAVNSKPIRRTASAGTPAPATALKSVARLADKARDRRDGLVAGKAGSATAGKKRRQRKRSSAQQTAVKPSGKKRVLVSRSTAQQAAPQSRVSQPKKSSRSRQKVARLVRRQPIVSVVPANHDNRLDWAEGSLAHDMDRRHSMGDTAPQRRVSSM